MNATVVMAEERRANRPQGAGRKNPGSAAATEGKPEYTTFRIFAADGENLSDLADKRNTTIAKLYHELFSEAVRKLLIEETKQRLKNLESRD